MGSRYYQRPENAISKADEFIKVGKPARALDTLYDVIKSKKRNHSVSEKLIEEIMNRYLELCVDLKKSHVAKEGLFQYRNMCQSTNVASLATVVQGYLNMAEKRTESARQESADSVDVDDLENIATPEMIMLSAVSGEGAQDRSDRTILAPWVKFLWESYCQCLELLRTNSRVERLYHNIAQQAFKFCLKYQRKTEFRKLCDKLRNHLDLIIKQQSPTANTINLNNADTQQWNLDTRLTQLDAAIHMELWQEAYKAVEDIHGLMQLSKKVFQPKMMANYYQKLALVFWKSGNFLFHAAAVFKHFQLTREMKKNISGEELAKMASRVVGAVLCVPLPSQHPEFDRFIETDRSPAEKMSRLAVLLALAQPPTRSSLLKDCVRFGVVGAAGQQMKDLYNWLEVEFHPLHLCGKVDASLKALGESEDGTVLSQYSDALRDMTLIRLLKQVAQVYQSVSMKRLVSLAKFSSHYHLERLIVECARNNDMQVRIDHRTGSVHFGTDLSEAQRTDLSEGPTIQNMPSEQVRTQLMSMMSVLDKSLTIICPDRNVKETGELRQRITKAYHESKDRVHQAILIRKEIIEKRKEQQEQRNNEQQEVEIRRKEKERKRIQAEEAIRLQKEQIERERLRKENELRAIQNSHRLNKINQLVNSPIGDLVLKGLTPEQIRNLEPDEIINKQVEALDKEKKELQVRLKLQEKKVDHLERAKRHEEIPLLKLQFEELKEENKQVWEEQEKERIENEKTQRENDVKNRDRMEVMKAEKDLYLDGLLRERKNIFEKKLAEFNVTVAEERKLRLQRRKEEREEDRRNRWLQEKREEEQREKDEEAKRLKEEKEEREAAERQKREEEYAKKKAELDEIERKKREKEEQIEKRQEQERLEERRRQEAERERPAGEERRGWREREETSGGGGSNSGSAWKAGGGGWRDRERKKEDQWAPQSGGRADRDDRRGSPRRGSPRRGSPRRGSPRRGSPPPREGGGSWRREGPERSDRSPPRRDGRQQGSGAWRQGGPGGGGRDFGDRRSPPRRDGRDVPSRRSPDRDVWRRGGAGGGGGPDRSPPRGGGRDRDFGGPRGGGRDRDFGARDARDAPASRRDNAGPRDDGPSDWRQGPPRGAGGERRPQPREERPREEKPREEKPRERPAGEPDEGWTKVKR